MTYTRGAQARQLDALRDQLRRITIELESTRAELEDTRRQLNTNTQPGNISNYPGQRINHRKPVAECGTYSGYVRHVRNGEVRCDPCKTAHALYLREYRARKAA